MANVLTLMPVTTAIFALPLGCFLTRRHVGRREVIGAVVIVIGLGAILLYETLSRPTWHTVTVVLGLSLSLVGAVVISLAHETAKDEAAAAADAVATA